MDIEPMTFEPFYSSSAGNLYRLSSDGVAPLLIECGVPLLKIKQSLGYRLSEVCGCLVSHSHADHSKSVEDLMKAGIDCYMSPETAAATIGGRSFHRLHQILLSQPFNVGTWRIVAFQTEHDCAGSLGFLISDGREKCLFATDTYFVRNRFRQLAIIAIECNYSLRTLAPDLDPVVRHRLLRSHMSLETCLDFLRAQDLSTVREIHLLHLSAGNSDAELFKREAERATGKPVEVAEEKI